MLEIPLMLVDGVLTAEHQPPSNALRIDYDGAAMVCRVYLPGDELPVAAKTAGELATEAREAFKAERQQVVDSIIVTTASGRQFDGNEVAQGRMDRAANSLDHMTAMMASGTPIILDPAVADGYRVMNGIYEIVWVLADNTPAFVGALELREALIRAGAAQAAAWVP
jgi:hypothetical protein